MKYEHFVFLVGKNVAIQEAMSEGIESSSCDAAKSAGHGKRPRNVLSSEQAVEIFKYKDTLGSDRLTGPSIELASKYNVSSKTIRDIWSGRSWQEVTGHVRLQGNSSQDPSRKPGRPIGSKDRKPRSKRSNTVPSLHPGTDSPYCSLNRGNAPTQRASGCGASSTDDATHKFRSPRSSANSSERAAESHIQHSMLSGVRHQDFHSRLSTQSAPQNELSVAASLAAWASPMTLSQHKSMDVPDPSGFQQAALSPHGSLLPPTTAASVNRPDISPGHAGSIVLPTGFPMFAAGHAGHGQGSISALSGAGSHAFQGQTAQAIGSWSGSTFSDAVYHRSGAIGSGISSAYLHGGGLLDSSLHMHRLAENSASNAVGHSLLPMSGLYGSMAQSQPTSLSNPLQSPFFLTNQLGGMSASPHVQRQYATAGISEALLAVSRSMGLQEDIRRQAPGFGAGHMELPHGQPTGSTLMHFTNNSTFSQAMPPRDPK